MSGKRRVTSAWVAAVAAVVRSIPKGSTLSYGQVAMMAGKPGAARAVVQALHLIPNVRWWRVVRSDRTVAREMAAEQIPLLRREGVRIVGRRLSG